MIVLGLILTLLSFINKSFLYGILELIGLYAIVVMLLIIITSAYLMIKKENKFAIFFLVSVSFWMAGLIIYLFRDFGILPDNFFTLHAIKFGVAFEVSIMSILLILRFRTIINDANEKLKKQNKLLVYAKQQAETSDNLKTLFLNNLSHEIRTPLNSIVGFSELISAEGVDPGDAVRFSGIISNNAYHLTDIVEDILAISSIELGNYQLNYSKGYLRKNLEECNLTFEKLRERFDNHNNLNVKNEVPKDLLVNFDQVKTPILVAHLVANALKFTQNGDVNVEYAFVNSNLIINISDTGIGISEKEQVKIFDQFYKVDEVQYTYRGNGVGLPIVKEIVDLYKGTIELYSKPNEGTEINIKLPMISF
jgi:signal transduction histidine kinase